VAYNNFLFIRLGDVLVLIGAFMLLNPWLKQGAWRRIGQKTLALYIVHYFILYGSLTGYGVNKYFARSLSLELTLATALGFILLCLTIVFGYEKLQKARDKRHKKT
jgi:peptidoglycan/LPS O-acetylase OafA/YrhL